MDIPPSFLESCFVNIPRGRYASCALPIFFLILIALTACSLGSTDIPGTEHLECSPQVHSIQHSMICTKQSPGDWPYKCVVSGSIENKGSGRASGVLVWVEFGRELNGVRNSTFNPIGDLNPGEKADFNNEIPAYELPSQYDIKIKCSTYTSGQPTRAPVPMIPLPGHALEGLTLSALAIDPVNPANLYAGTTASGLLKSTDGGLNWSESKMGVKFLQVLALAIDPINPTTIYASILVFDTGYPEGALYKSIDGGEHWVSITEGMGNVSIGTIKIDPLTPRTIYADTEKGLIKSMDGGVHWQALNLGSFGPYISNLVMDPLTPATLYGTSVGNGVIKSTNGGEEWSKGNAGLTNLDLTTLVIDPVTPTRLYTISWKGVFKTIDAAMSCSMVNSRPIKNGTIAALAIDPGAPATLYAAFYQMDTDSSKIIKSTDEGETWYEVDANTGTSYISSIVMDPATPTIIYLLTNDGLFFIGK
jgi:hypothetical protein